MTVENTIYKMLTENTGTHMLDSGGARGRHWQRNEGKTIEDFKKSPPAILDFTYDYPEFTVSIFHKLTCGLLELDDICDEFNSIEIGSYNGELFNTSQEQCDLLRDAYNFDWNENGQWNTYNFDNCFSQVLIGHELRCDHSEDYLLLAIHGGADVRGGYTDAKLFRCNDEPWYIVDDSCYFQLGNMMLDHRAGETFNEYGNEACDEYIEDFKKLLPENKKVEGFIASY